MKLSSDTERYKGKSLKNAAIRCHLSSQIGKTQYWVQRKHLKPFNDRNTSLSDQLCFGWNPFPTRSETLPSPFAIFYGDLRYVLLYARKTINQVVFLQTTKEHYFFIIPKMPRSLDIGWEHGKMVGEQRNHVLCNYCNRAMIGGITRFKKHLANESGEIRGCEAVPIEVRDAMRKHLSSSTPRKFIEKKQRKSMIVPVSTKQSIDSNGSDANVIAANYGLEFQRDDHESASTVAREYFDAVSEKKGIAPPRATDIGWFHGTMVSGDRQKIKCNYCSKIMLGGGISRLKQHLAGERGNISPCEKVPDDVRAQIQQHIGFKTLERLKKQKESDNIRSSNQNFSHENYYIDDGCDSGFKRKVNGKKRGKEVEDMWPRKRKRTQKPFVSQAVVNSTFVSQGSNDQADMAVAKFMFDAGIPFNTANSYYFQKMADAIACAGPGYRMPSYQSLRNKLLDKCGHEVGEVCKENRKSWKLTGCTVMVDRWVDAIGQVVINFFVYCPKGTMLIKSVDASDIDHSTDGLLSLFDSVVHDVDPSNIVNFITDTTPSYKAAGKLLMRKYKMFFWSICANHTIESVLKEFSELDEVKEVLKKAKRICQFIYNNAWVLNLLRKRTEGADIFQPAMTEFVTKFITLDSMVSLKKPIHLIFTSPVWEQSIYSNQEASEEVTEIVLSSQFWLSCEQVVKISKPLVTVLHLADSEERPSMGYLYDAMEKAKRSIILAFNDEEKDYLPYVEIIDRARDKLHSPLHAAAYYLNPSMYYSPSFSMNNVIQKGLLDCIEILEPDLTVQVNITRHKTCYEDAFGDFSRPVALRGRETVSPATWWSLYSSDYPDLQRFAVRILSQTCCITTPERTWNVNECIHTRNSNKLERERLTDLTFVHYNLRLQQRQLATSGTKGPRKSEHDPVSLEGRNYNIGEWIEDPGIAEGEDTSWMNVALPSEDEDDNDSNGDSIATETSD